MKRYMVAKPKTHLLFPAQLQEDLLDLLPPVILHYVETLVRGLRERRVDYYV
jgi:hypothetical protein